MIKLKSLLKENYYKKLSDDERDTLANSYFSIGHDGEDGEEPDDHYCWMWNGNDVIFKKGGNHSCNFGTGVAETTFKGWYDVHKRTVSVSFPERERRKLGDRRPTEDDIPQYLYQKLINKFGKYLKPKFVLFENTLLTEVNLRGEWWFEDGNATFADGDVGDMNHEAHVISRLKCQILDSLSVDVSDYEHIPEFYDLKDEIFQNIGDELTPEELEDWKQDEINSVIASYLTRHGESNIKERLQYIRGHSDKGQTLDVREYALTHWGWQRVKGNVIQTQTLTSKDLQNIVNGLGEAYNEELDEKDEENVSEDNPFGEVTFNIEVMSTRSWYTGIPISVLEKKNPVALNPYRTRY